MKAAFMAMDGCALWQVAMLQKLLSDDGWTWRTLTLNGESVRSDGGLRLAADTSIDRASPRDYQLVLLAGGNIDSDQVEHPGLLRFLRQYDGQGRLIAASCASAVFLAAAGLLGGRKFTALSNTVAHFSEYFSRSIYVNQDVCRDGNIITSKGQAHLEFAFAVCQNFDLDKRDGKALTMARKLARNET